MKVNNEDCLQNFHCAVFHFCGKRSSLGFVLMCEYVAVVWMSVPQKFYAIPGGAWILKKWTLEKGP